MVYLDYSATTKPRDEVIDSFVKVSKDYIGNANSLHILGVNSKNLIDSSTKQIANILNIKDDEIIYTSGSSESNNLAIVGICEYYNKRGKHIITTHFEHSSIYGPINYLVKKGYKVDYVKTDKNGQVDLEDLKKLMSNDTILVSIGAVNSEIGILQPVNEIGKIVKQYPKCFYHSDITQAVGKINIDLSNVDLASFSAHKFYGLKGIGILIKKEKIELDPIIHGGKSTTIYRSGTPSVPLIVSISKALRLSYDNIDKKYEYVNKLNTYLKDNLKKYDKVIINSNDKCIPHILNVSLMGVKPETLLHALEEYEIYISTKSACSQTNTKSEAVYSLTGDENISKYSVRISLSYLTTKEEIDYFIKCFDKCYENLTNLK